MFVSDILTSTAVKVKELSTNIFVRIARNMKERDFCRRNSKVITVCLACWLTLGLVGYYVHRSGANRAREDFLQQGVTAASDLATNSAPLVLEKEILALSVEIRELEKLNSLKFAVISDHNDMVLAQTGADLRTGKLVLPGNAKPIAEIGDIKISENQLPNKTKYLGFMKHITYSSVDIGMVYIALSKETLVRTINYSRIFFLAGTALLTVIIVAIVFLHDRRTIAKALKIKQEVESMQRIGPYRIQRKIAQGGMAELFLADYLREDGFRRKVAIKRILPNLAGNVNFIRMFTREARLAALLQHPNIVQIFDYGKIESTYFIAMEYINGKNLKEIITAMKQGLPIEHTIFIISKICKGLDYSHIRRDEYSDEPLKIIHRDISPQNMLISYEGEVKISDFGISKARSEPSLTRAGVIKGKLAYLSPEQSQGDPVDERTDIYALGLVFYEAINGKKVYSFDTDVEAIRSIPTMEIEPLINTKAGIPAELNDIVMKCLAKNKEERYQSASLLYNDLDNFKKKMKITFDTSDLASFMREHFDRNGITATS
jgi:tRNA A-37 threonylcarbamoyl transferase component Bud32